MRRHELPYLSHYWELAHRQHDEEEVAPVDGRVRVYEHVPDHPLDPGKREGSFFLVQTPREREATTSTIPCTPEECRRWVRAAVAYATTLDAITAELRAAYFQVVGLNSWQWWATRRALAVWVETRERYERSLRAAQEAYAPIGAEIRAVIRAEEDKRAELAREQARLAAEERARKARLAERPVWGWYVVTNGRRTVHVFRHDVPGEGSPPAAEAEEIPRVDMAGLRRALRELNLPDVVWDRAAVRKSGHEARTDFAAWWREQFYEDYRTFTQPPPPPSSSRRPGGSGTSGSGGYSGGFSCVGGF